MQDTTSFTVNCLFRIKIVGTGELLRNARILRLHDLNIAKLNNTDKIVSPIREGIETALEFHEKTRGGRPNRVKAEASYF